MREMRCRGCRSASLDRVLDFGLQPVCSRYLAGPTDAEALHPLVLGQCPGCGLVQLERAVPAAELMPPYAWIAYREPEAHLDQVADVVAGLPGLGPGAVACGLSYKDDSTLERLRARGFATWRIDLARDLGVDDPRAGVETVQDRLRPDVAAALAGRRGRPRLVVARHILEHAEDPHAFVAALRRLVDPDGYVVLEVPDCSRALETCDYTTVWEEHVLYFTPETFRACCEFTGLGMVRIDCHPYLYENSLVAITRQRTLTRASLPGAGAPAHERERMERFARAFPELRQTLRRFLAAYRERHGGIVALGAGHLACAFINLMGLADLLASVADDDQNKQGLFMPGSRLAIRGSAVLSDAGITLCLMSVNPQSEDAVIRRHVAFVERGGTFASIFPSSPRALRVTLDGGLVK